MANAIEYQTLMAEVLDKKLAATSKTASMEENAVGLIYTGGNKFQLAKMDFGSDGVSDYDRAKGYVTGSVTLEYELKQFKKDWGKKFTLDAMDVDESNFQATMQTVMAEYVRTVEVPAVDRFRFSEIIKLAEAGAAKGAHVETYTVAASGALAQLRKSFSEAMTGTGLENTDLTAYVSRSYYNALIGDKDVQKVINLTGSAIALNGNTKSVDGTLIVVVDDDVLGCLYIVCATKAPIAIAKHHVSKIFSPEQNQDADAYVGAERLYHTLEIADNYLPTVVVVKAAG